MVNREFYIENHPTKLYLKKKTYLAMGGIKYYMYIANYNMLIFCFDLFTIFIITCVFIPLWNKDITTTCTGFLLTKV